MGYSTTVSRVVGPPAGAEVWRPMTLPGLRPLAAGQGRQQGLDRRAVHVLVEIVVHLEDRRVHAAAEAFHLAHGEHPVGAGLVPVLDAGHLAAGRLDLVGAAQPAGRGDADLQVVAADRRGVEHQVEGRDLVDADRRHLRAGRPPRPSPRAAPRRCRSAADICFCTSYSTAITALACRPGGYFAQCASIGLVALLVELEMGRLRDVHPGSAPGGAVPGGRSQPSSGPPRRTRCRSTR